MTFKFNPGEQVRSKDGFEGRITSGHQWPEGRPCTYRVDGPYGFRYFEEQELQKVVPAPPFKLSVGNLARVAETGFIGVVRSAAVAGEDPALYGIQADGEGKIWYFSEPELELVSREDS